jgi:hypothetical protein
MYVDTYILLILLKEKRSECKVYEVLKLEFLTVQFTIRNNSTRNLQKSVFDVRVMSEDDIDVVKVKVRLTLAVNVLGLESGCPEKLVRVRMFGPEFFCDVKSVDKNIFTAPLRRFEAVENLNSKF